MKIPGTEREVTPGAVWKTLTMAATVIVAWVWIQSQFMEQSDFEAYAAGQTTQQTKNIRAQIQMEIRWLQSEKRRAKKEGDQDKESRLADDIKNLERDLGDLTTTQ